MKNLIMNTGISRNHSNKLIISLILLFSVLQNPFSQTLKKISQDELRDKISGYWIGQCVGNYMGFPFEGRYPEESVPVLVNRYYQDGDDPSLNINKDHRGNCLMLTQYFEGAFSDDDTDIEFVTLHAVEKYGLDINYAEITDMWKKHINRKIWCANRTARDLMAKGLIAPETGKKENNENWYQIDPQLVNEIWSMFYPGMIKKSAERAEWGARITSDDWGTHPTIAYGAMYSAAVFEKDVNKLVATALSYIPETSPFHEGMKDVIAWHKQNPDWRVTRKMIFDKYFRYKKGDYSAPVSDVSALSNGLFGIMAILYGQGDFLMTTGIAVSAGMDCDNQSATCAGLIGVIKGASSIPPRLTLGLSDKPLWKLPFNDTYINFSRDDLPPYTKISDIVSRILVIAEEAILDGGGKKISENNKTYYLINSDLK
jgi:ADP-ribosylglycohydrolase